jgi:anti-sigma factor RsiW
MPCDLGPITLAAYLDGELQPEEAAAAHRHIASCASCASEVADLAALRRGLRAARNRYLPDNDFRRKIQRQISQRPRPYAPQRYIPALIAFAAILLLAIVWTSHSYKTDAFAEIADLHINALSSANPVDVVSTDRHTVKPWFEGRIPFSFNVPELAGSEFNLLGARVIYFHQQPGAQLMVGMKQHKLSVLVFQESPQIAREFLVSGGAARHNSFNIETWKSQDLRFFVIGDTGSSEIQALARFFRQVN